MQSVALPAEIGQVFYLGGCLRFGVTKWHYARDQVVHVVQGILATGLLKAHTAVTRIEQCQHEED